LNEIVPVWCREQEREGRKKKEKEREREREREREEIEYFIKCDRTDRYILTLSQLFLFPGPRKTESV